MQAKADAQLLREYARQGSDAAFGEIVARYTDLVYGAVLRQVGSADLAQEIAQSVFTDLARKASSLAESLDENGTIVGWLYKSSRFALSKHLRAEQRRHNRERLAMEDFDPTSTTPPDWERVRPVLDEALADLSEEDRQAMLLRFFQNQGFQSVGAALGISDDAAQKRVGRALEKLRAHLTRHGITTTAALLSDVLSTNAYQTAPAGLAAKLAGAALSGAAVSTTSTLTVMTIASQKIGIVATGVATVLAVCLAAEHRSVGKLQEENAALRQQISQATQAPPVAVPPAEPVLADVEELARLRNEHGELLRLRGEVGILRDTQEKQQKELASVHSEKDQMVAVEKAEAARVSAVNYLKIIGVASRVFANTNGEIFPTSLGQIKDNLVTMGMERQMGIQEIEFIDYGQPVTTSANPNFFFAREKQPRQMPDGKWSRAYLLMDGAVQTAESDTGDFGEWEKQWNFHFSRSGAAPGGPLGQNGR